MTDLIVSLKYSPGHYSHLLAWYKIFEEIGRTPVLVLDKDYYPFIKKEKGINFSISSTKPNNDYNIVLIYNTSVKNEAFLNKVGRSKKIFVYHEPGITLLERTKEGCWGFLKSATAYFFNRRILKRVDKILVPSKNAKYFYELYDADQNENINFFPLIFEDESFENIETSPKRDFFSYIGTVAKAHDFEGFLSYMRYAREMGMSTRFLVATRTNLDKLMKNPLIHQMISDDQLQVIHGKPLTNREINNCFARSFCVWNVYRRSTQSGVLGKAFMFGTPVIASPVGSFPEFVNNGLNGELISMPNDFEGITDALGKIEKSFGTYSSEARKTFLETFYYKANTQRLKEIIDDVRGE